MVKITLRDNGGSITVEKNIFDVDKDYINMSLLYKY